MTKIIKLQILAFILLMTAGCPDLKTGSEKAYLIRVGETFITEREFESAFEFDKAAYSYEVIHNPTVLKGLRIQFLKEISERLILMERARELGIHISESEVESAVSDMKKGYPEGEFEKTLLKSAVSYESWKAELKARLLMEKVIAKDLSSGISVHPDEIKEYYKQNVKKETSKSKHESREIEQMIMERLRKHKTEAAYKDWIEKLQEKYTIQINDAEWEKIAGS